MPYRNLAALPKGVKNNLPKPAQEIYRQTYNSAWKTYKDPERRRGGASRRGLPPSRLGGGQARIKERRAHRQMETQARQTLRASGSRMAERIATVGPRDKHASKVSVDISKPVALHFVFH